MKTQKTTLIIAIALWAFSPAFLIAQDKTKDRATQAVEMQERLNRLLKRYPESDINKDGTLTEDEVKQFNRSRREAQKGTGERPTRDGKREKPQQRGPEATHADVKYGEHEKQAFDIWLAESKDGKPTPLCIYIHGGGFRGGDKKGAGRSAKVYLDAGISFASMNYRLSEGGKNPYPIAMHDSARGLQFIRSKAKEWNIDSDKVACYGGSAGAGISLWLGFHEDLADPKSDDPVARQSTRLVAAGTSGGQSTYDMRTFRKWFDLPELVPHEALVTFYNIQSDEDWESERVKGLMKDASAITHLTKDDVPVYMKYGKGDVPVTMESSASLWVHHVRLGLKLKEAMEKLGMECTVVSKDHHDDRYKNMEDFLIQKLRH